MDEIKRGFLSKVPATDWQEALVTGNGTIGALVYGQPYEETVIFNHEELYEPFHENVVQNNDLAPSLPEIRKLMHEGKFRDAASVFSERSGHPLLFTDAYHPAFALKWSQMSSTEVESYARAVDFETGEITVQWQDDVTQFERKLFVSRSDHAVVLQLSSNRPDTISGSLAIADLVLAGSAMAEVRTVPGQLQFACKYKITKKGYVGCLQIRLEGKQASTSIVNNQLLIENATEVRVVVKLAPLADYEQQKDSWFDEMNELLTTLASVSYERLLKRHALIHREWFNRMSLTLGKKREQLIIVEDLLIQREEGVNEKLVELMFDMGRYLFICSSGTYPPNLVGLWSGDWRPPWSGDFTTDANLNLAVSGAGIGNMREALEGYFHLIEKIVPDWKTNAKKMFGCRGVLAGSRTDGNHNIHTHFDVEWPLGFWTAGAAWLASPFMEWFQISGDRLFFQERVLPLMKEIALFYEDFLTEEDEHGNAVFIPSYSPENTPIIDTILLQKGWQPSQATINATMDLACAREVLTHLITTCSELRIEQDKLTKWRTLLEKLPPYLINEDGALKEWAHPLLDDQYDHRHISHLYPVWPGHEIMPEATPALYDAAKKALAKRNRGNESAHGVMHCGIVAARLKQKDDVLENMKFLLHDGNYIHSSLVTSHNPGRKIYNVDANCSLPTLVMEMLVYSRPGRLELLPALPDQFQTGGLQGLLTRSELTVEQLEWDLGKSIVKVNLCSQKSQVIELKMSQEIRHYQGNCGLQQLDQKGQLLIITLAENERIELSIQM